MGGERTGRAGEGRGRGREGTGNGEEEPRGVEGTRPHPFTPPQK